MSDARLRNLERELALDPARVDVLEEHARLLDRAGCPDEALASLDLAWRLGHEGLETELHDRLLARRLRHGDLEFCYVPAGPFLMGCEGGDPDEGPAHIVRLSAFYMAARPVRWGDLEGWEDLTEREASRLPGIRELEITGYVFDEVRPAIAALSRRSGDDPSYRLPTEAQWERVRRASNLPRGRHVYGVNVLRVIEWTRDFYDSTAYDRDLRMDPVGPPEGEHRVIRGTFEGPSFVQRATYRESANELGQLDAARSEASLAPDPKRAVVQGGIAFRPCFPACLPALATPAKVGS